MPHKLNRREFLDALAVAGAAAAGLTARGCSSADTGEETSPATEQTFHAAVAGFENDAARARAVQKVVELLGGMPWLKPGDTVLIKPCINSPYPYPFTASPVACAELVRLCLDAGAGRVYIADCMGAEHTLVLGGWHLENPWGMRWGAFKPDRDATVRAMRNTGLYQSVVDTVGAGDVGKDRVVQITSFREHGWRRWESESDTPGGAANTTLHSEWVKAQLSNAVNWEGHGEFRVYMPRLFDAFRRDVPGVLLPRLVDEVDHIINLHRVSTHLFSHATHGIKNWIGLMRPDDRLWMHQLNYLKNTRFPASDPSSNEPPYHEQLAELHLTTWERERLILADAAQVIVSGGPDETDREFYPGRLMIGATDLVSADVLAVAVLKLGVLAPVVDGGLAGQCEPQVMSVGELLFEYVGEWLPWFEGFARGTHPKLCDPGFSPWDWLSIRRATELGMGPSHPSQLGLAFADGEHAVRDDQREFITSHVGVPPAAG